MTTARNTTRETIRFYLLIDHRIVLLFHVLVPLVSPFPSCRRDALTLRIPVSCLVANGTRPVFSFLGGEERKFLHPPTVLLSLLLHRPRESVSYLPPKFLPDECGIAHGKDHRYQLRGTGSWRLISSSDHSRMNRSTWATMLTGGALLWVADYKRMVDVVYSWNLFLFYICRYIPISLTLAMQLFYQ